MTGVLHTEPVRHGPVLRQVHGVDGLLHRQQGGVLERLQPQAPRVHDATRGNGAGQDGCARGEGGTRARGMKSQP